MTSKKQSVKKPALNAEMKYHLIDKYREMVRKRYDHKTLKKARQLPDDITKEIVDTLRDYFLESLYPEPAKREKLDAAFEELQNYVLHPGRIADLIGNIGSAIFRFGLQFPLAVKSGISALEVHTEAKHFENALLSGAQENNFSIPITDEQFLVCLRSIPQPQLEKFINEVGGLFHSFSNTELLVKTVAIMDDVLVRMRSKEGVYSHTEIEAIEIGKDIIQKGHDLFVHLTKDQKQQILDLITTNEREFLEGVYAD